MPSTMPSFIVLVSSLGIEDAGAEIGALKEAIGCQVRYPLCSFKPMGLKRLHRPHGLEMENTQCLDASLRLMTSAGFTRIY